MQQYVFHVHHRDRASPEVLDVGVRNDARARELARERLVENHLYIEVWREERRLFRVSREEDQSA